MKISLILKIKVELYHLLRIFIEAGFNKNYSRDFPGGPVVKTSPSNAGGAGSIPGWGAKVPYASWTKNQNIKQKQYCNKDLKNDPHQKKIFKKKIYSKDNRVKILEFT